MVCVCCEMEWCFRWCCSCAPVVFGICLFYHGLFYNFLHVDVWCWLNVLHTKHTAMMISSVISLSDDVILKANKFVSVIDGFLSKIKLFYIIMCFFFFFFFKHQPNNQFDTIYSICKQNSFSIPLNKRSNQLSETTAKQQSQQQSRQPNKRWFQCCILVNEIYAYKYYIYENRN